MGGEKKGQKNYVRWVLEYNELRHFNKKLTVSWLPNTVLCYPQLPLTVRAVTSRGRIPCSEGFDPLN